MLGMKFAVSQFFLLGYLLTNAAAIPMSEAPQSYAPFVDGECMPNRWYAAQNILAENGTIPFDHSGDNAPHPANLYMCYTAEDFEDIEGAPVHDLRDDGTKKNQLRWEARCEYEVRPFSYFEYTISAQGRKATCEENGEMLSSRTVPGYIPSN